MAKTVGDFFWERLYEWGVSRVFGCPGDGINGLPGGLNRFGTDKIQFVRARRPYPRIACCTADRSAALV